MKTDKQEIALWFYFRLLAVNFPSTFSHLFKKKINAEDKSPKETTQLLKKKKIKNLMFSFYLPLIPVITIPFVLDRNLIFQSFLTTKIPLVIRWTWGYTVSAWHNSKFSTVKTLLATIREPSPSSAAIAGVCSVKVSLFSFFNFQIFFSPFN